MKKVAPNIAIVGGGIAGLTCALALAERGIGSTLFEQAEVLQEIGAGIQLSPNAIRPLEALGLMPAINGFASAPRSIDIFSGHSCRPIIKLPLGAAIEKRFNAPYLSVHRADLQQVLAQACARMPQIQINLGAQIERIPSINGKAYILGRSYDLVIAADGVNSKLRQQCYNLEPFDSGLVAWRSTMAMDKRPPSISRASTTLCLGASAHLVAYPIASGLELNAVAILPGGISIEDGFKKWSPKWKLLSGSDWKAWPLKTAPHLVSRLNGPFIFLGDAAHAMLPFAAQGGAMAIEDGFTLATAIAHLEQFQVKWTPVHRPELQQNKGLEHFRDSNKSGNALGTNKNALAIWAKTREARTAKVRAVAAQNRQIYHLPAPLSFARDNAMRLIGAQRLMARQDWIYGFDATAWSPNSRD